jgi:hypothetical protein
MVSQKRSLQVVNEHLIRFAHPFGGRAKARSAFGCEPVFNAVMATQVVFQQSAHSKPKEGPYAFDPRGITPVAGGLFLLETG